MASSEKTAPWTNRLTRFPAVRKWSFIAWNRMDTSNSPATTGRMPVSPPRIRANDALRYSPTEFATSSEGTVVGSSSSS